MLYIDTIRSELAQKNGIIPSMQHSERLGARESGQPEQTLRIRAARAPRQSDLLVCNCELRAHGVMTYRSFMCNVCACKATQLQSYTQFMKEHNTNAIGLSQQACACTHAHMKRTKHSDNDPMIQSFLTMGFVTLLGLKTPNIIKFKYNLGRLAILKCSSQH